MQTSLLAAAAMGLLLAIGATGDVVGPPLWKGAGIPGTKFNMLIAADRAVKLRPGEIVDLELKKAAGGSGLRYQFIIVSHATRYRVAIDAKTGKTLENRPATEPPR
jgi:hypothetical protein